MMPSCPNCKEDMLMLEDENFIDWNEIETFLICTACGDKFRCKGYIDWDDLENEPRNQVKGE